MPSARRALTLASWLCSFSKRSDSSELALFPPAPPARLNSAGMPCLSPMTPSATKSGSLGSGWGLGTWGSGDFGSWTSWPVQRGPLLSAFWLLPTEGGRARERRVLPIKFALAWCFPPAKGDMPRCARYLGPWRPLSGRRAGQVRVRPSTSRFPV